jgi:hypothetical protein
VEAMAIRMGLVDGFGNPVGGRTRWVSVRGGAVQLLNLVAPEL